MEIKLYHGSDHRIEHPDIKLGKKTNDYGAGFYMTEDIELAKEWAAKNNSECFLNEYIFNYDNLKVLNLLDGNYNVLNWIALLLKNRVFNETDVMALEAKEYILNNFLIDISDYDVIIGYRADDSYFSYAQSFINNSLSIEALSKALKLGNLGVQIVLVSDKAINNLQFIGASVVDEKKYFKLFSTRDYKAREEYHKCIRNKSNYKTDIFIMDVMRMEMKNNDKRLQRFIFK